MRTVRLVLALPPTVAQSDQWSAVDVAAARSDEWSDNDATYSDSPFLPLKALSSRKKGAEFEKIFDTYMTRAGYEVKRADSSDFDRFVDGHRVEVKGSFLWAGKQFRWQQIRTAQQYDYLVCLAFYPDRLELYSCSRTEAERHLTRKDAEGNCSHNQHGGKTGDSGTYFIDGLPADFPWLKTLSAGFPAPLNSPTTAT